MTEAEKSEGSAEQATKELSEEEEQPKKKQKTSNDAEEDQEGNQEALRRDNPHLTENLLLTYIWPSRRVCKALWQVLKDRGDLRGVFERAALRIGAPT